jgi:hypothetical protein
VSWVGSGVQEKEARGAHYLGQGLKAAAAATIGSHFDNVVEAFEDRYSSACRRKVRRGPLSVRAKRRALS